MKKAQLDSKFKNPLMVVTTRLEFIKKELTGLIKNVEAYAIERQKNDDKHPCIISADEWVHAALNSLDPHWKKKIATTNILGKKVMPDRIPLDIISKLPCTIGELITLGSWSLTKNIYRFEDEIINKLIETEYNKDLPSFLLNIVDLSVYIQTDNADLFFNNTKIVGVIFSKNTFDDQDVLFTTIYFDHGMSRTITMKLPEENGKSKIEDCMGDFIDSFFAEDARPHDDEIEAFTKLQKKLINLLLWFSQSEPDFIPLDKEPKTKAGLVTVKREIRLFEAQAYKPYIAGAKAKIKLREAMSEYERILKTGNFSGGRIPHPRKAHWNYYWIGKRGMREKWVSHWIPFQIIGGVPKDK